MEMKALRGIVKDGACTTLYNYFTEYGLAQISVDFLLGTAGTEVQGKVRELLRAMEDNLLGESMTDVHALVSREFFDKLIAHPKTEEAYRFYAATGAQPCPMPCMARPQRSMVTDGREQGTSKYFSHRSTEECQDQIEGQRQILDLRDVKGGERPDGAAALRLQRHGQIGQSTSAKRSGGVPIKTGLLIS